MNQKRVFLFEADEDKRYNETIVFVKKRNGWVRMSSFISKGQLVRMTLPLGATIKVSNHMGEKFFYAGNGGLKRIKAKNA